MSLESWDLTELTLEGTFAIGLAEELSLQKSSSGGGSMLPERWCRMFVAPVICWTLLLQNY